MTNEMILTDREQKLNKFFNLMQAAMKRPVDNITLYYNKVLERELNNKQVLCLLNVQLAFIMTVFPIDCSFLLRIVCICWLLTALLKCREELREE